MAEGCYYLNPKMEFVFINKAAETMIVKSKDELIGVCLWDALPSYKNTETYSKFLQAFDEQKIQSFEVLSNYSNKYFEVKVVPDQKGILVILSDITEQKKHEEEQRYYEKIKLIGEMAAGVAHEIRNPLTTVKGFLQLGLHNKDFVNHKKIFELMIDEINRVNSMITEFLDIGKKKPNKLEIHNLNHIINSLYPLLETKALQEDKQIVRNLGDIPNLMIDQDEIRQLLLNMVNNSLDAMEPRKTVHINTFIENDKIVMSINDEGNGIPSEIIERISTPFVTSKENGTGLGLAICFAIAKRNNATIDFSTSVNGTIFNIRFSNSLHI
ncbi:two-component system sensor histidine kinase NtrB [Gottfriedia luciferensis]|uniref:two-component system sensor histidine kinase NtrB n=1 Tax=Gottfriedia luciferensis TaxID=178774 RepID=UPI000B44B2DE|nr:ATP-binding protein [Gottfriedia luciferensis]